MLNNFDKNDKIFIDIFKSSILITVEKSCTNSKNTKKVRLKLLKQNWKLVYIIARRDVILKKDYLSNLLSTISCKNVQTLINLCRILTKII